MNINVEVLEYYEKEEYIEDSRKFALSNKKLREDLIRKHFPVRNILELGCSSAVLKDIHTNYVGLDISSSALRNLSGKGIQCDIQNIPVQDKTFDMICSFNVLEHVHDPKTVLKECNRILRSGGILILGDAWNCERDISIKNKLFRYILCRIIDRLKFLVHTKVKLRVESLVPDYSKIGGDWDAVSSIDHHNVVYWLKTHGYTVMSKWNRKAKYIEARKDETKV